MKFLIRVFYRLRTFVCVHRWQTPIEWCTLCSRCNAIKLQDGTIVPSRGYV